MRITNNSDGWHYDNCRVPRNGFTLGGIETVLRPFLNRVRIGQVIQSWQKAVTVTHQAVVDGMANAVKNPAAYCIGTFKLMLAEFSNPPPEKEVAK